MKTMKHVPCYGIQLHAEHILFDIECIFFIAIASAFIKLASFCFAHAWPCLTCQIGPTFASPTAVRPVKKENRDWLEVLMCFVVSVLPGETNWNGEIRWPSTPTNILNTMLHMDLMIWSEIGATTTHNSTWFCGQRLPSKDEHSHCWLIDMSIICSSFCIFPETSRNECASMTTIYVITWKASQDVAVASSSYSCLWTVSVKSLLKAKQSQLCICKICSMTFNSIGCVKHFFVSVPLVFSSFLAIVAMVLETTKKANHFLICSSHNPEQTSEAIETCTMARFI